MRLLLFLLAFSAACAAPEPPAATPIPDTAATAPDATAAALEAWTVATVEVPAQATASGRLVDVRTATHEGFDRVVFAFDGDGVPGYHVEYVDAPVYACGSGEVVPVAGEGWLEIRLTPTAAHTEAGESTLAERSRAPGLPVLRELALTCDFEAEVVWVAGMAAPNPFRVFTLRNRARLVVDVRH